MLSFQRWPCANPDSVWYQLLTSELRITRGDNSLTICSPWKWRTICIFSCVKVFFFLFLTFEMWLLLWRSTGDGSRGVSWGLSPNLGACLSFTVAFILISKQSRLGNQTRLQTIHTMGGSLTSIFHQRGETIILLFLPFYQSINIFFYHHFYSFILFLILWVKKSFLFVFKCSRFWKSSFFSKAPIAS